MSLATHLPRLKPDDVRARNLAHIQGGQIECTVLDQRLRMSLAPRDIPPMECAAWPVFAWAWGSAEVRVALDGVEAVLPGMHARALPDDPHQRLAVIDAVVSTLGARLGLAPRTLRQPQSCAGLRRSAALGLRVENLDTGARSQAWVELPEGEQAWLAWASAWRAARSFGSTRGSDGDSDASSSSSSLPVPVAFRIGAVALPLSQASSLGLGDVLMLTRLPSVHGSWACDLLVGAERKPWARGVLEGDRIVVNAVNVASAAAVADDVSAFQAEGEGAGADATMAASLERVSVALNFEIGRRSMPLADVLRLTPGYVFELGSNPEGEVIDIMVQQTRVGRGQLVLVGDALGIRVTAFELAPAQGAIAPQAELALVPGEA